MKLTDRKALEIANLGGVIPSSHWINGSGKHIKKRPIPKLCMEVEVGHMNALPHRSRQAAELLLKARPRIKKLIAISDWDALEKVKEMS